MDLFYTRIDIDKAEKTRKHSLSCIHFVVITAYILEKLFTFCFFECRCSQVKKYESINNFLKCSRFGRFRMQSYNFLFSQQSKNIMGNYSLLRNVERVKTVHRKEREQHVHTLFQSLAVRVPRFVETGVSFTCQQWIELLFDSVKLPTRIGHKGPWGRSLRLSECVRADY